MKLYFLALAVISLVIFLFISSSPKRYHVYGSMNCGWTKKQLDTLGSSAKFYDCDSGECPPNIKSYPVTIDTNTKQTYTGYTEKF